MSSSEEAKILMYKEATHKAPSLLPGRFKLKTPYTYLKGGGMHPVAL
jgi:hypothetical protein